VTSVTIEPVGDDLVTLGAPERDGRADLAHRVGVHAGETSVTGPPSLVGSLDVTRNHVPFSGLVSTSSVRSVSEAKNRVCVRLAVPMTF
jgi:hypothetical protein